MNFSFKNRIAFYYMMATALVVAVVFIIIFFIVKETVFQNLDSVLGFEAKKHTSEVEIREDKLFFNNKKEWEEHEHREVHVNPVFIQIIDRDGKLMDKSPNLKSLHLPFHDKQEIGDHFNTEFNGRLIRQVQVPMIKNGVLTGYIIAAMSLESSNMVIMKLRNVLFLLFPIILIGLFFISRYLAGRSIVPIKSIIDTTNLITKNNLNSRVELPINKDELFELSASINELLQRIEDAIKRERQFTSDASHELRTPLATLRGTLEVLGRKPRLQSEYEDKINFSLGEIDRMSNTIDQLLFMARLDVNKEIDNHQISIFTLIDDIISRYDDVITQKQLKIHFDTENLMDIKVPLYYANLILDNIINNAIKYTESKGQIEIALTTEKQSLVCLIEDTGIGIEKEDLDLVFQPFFRSEALSHKHISGNGLGLSIALKAAKAINAELEINSKKKHGTTVRIVF